MLWLASDWKLWQVSCVVDHASGRRPLRGAEFEQRLKRRHRCLPAVMPERELVQIHLQVVAAAPMVRPDEPLVEIPDGPVRQGHDRWGAMPQGASGRLLAGHVPDVGSLHAVPPFQRVGIDGRSWRNVLADEVQYRGLGEVRCHGQTHAAVRSARFSTATSTITASVGDSPAAQAVGHRSRCHRFPHRRAAARDSR